MNTSGPRDDVEVIIVAHDAGALLAACVASAVAQAGASRVIVVDTESTDGSVEAATSPHADVKVRRVPNRGFAFANNAGLSEATAPFALLLNPDAELRPGALDALVACANVHPRAAIIGAKVLNPDGTLQANQAGRFPSLLQVVGLRAWRAWQRLRGNTSLSPRDFHEARRTDWVTGACMLARTQAVAQVGPMDAGFFLYYEDTDWCHRMADRGWEVWQEPLAEVVHHLGGAGGASARASTAYRESFYRYCDLYRLWGLKGAARLGLIARAAAGAPR